MIAGSTAGLHPFIFEHLPLGPFQISPTAPLQCHHYPHVTQLVCLKSSLLFIYFTNDLSNCLGAPVCPFRGYPVTPGNSTISLLLPLLDVQGCATPHLENKVAEV